MEVSNPALGTGPIIPAQTWDGMSKDTCNKVPLCPGLRESTVRFRVLLR